MSDHNSLEQKAEPAKALQWIRLELLPLPDSEWSEKLLYWNPTSQELLGEGAEAVLELVNSALQEGHVSGFNLSQFEITNPLSQPSELAAILAKHFWVIPQPVKLPGLLVEGDENSLQ